MPRRNLADLVTELLQTHKELEGVRYRLISLDEELSAAIGEEINQVLPLLREYSDWEVLKIGDSIKMSKGLEEVHLLWPKHMESPNYRVGYFNGEDSYQCDLYLLPLSAGFDEFLSWVSTSLEETIQSVRQM